MRPLSCGLNCRRLIFLPPLCDIVGKWIVWVRGSEQRLDGEKYCTDLECRGPVTWPMSAAAKDSKQVPTLQDVQTDPAEFVNVGVVYLGQEADLGRSHGIVIGQEQLELENAAWDKPVSSYRAAYCTNAPS